jgi:hypothetical protein
MPLAYVDPETYLTHNGVPIYYTYRHDIAEDRHRYHFTTSTGEPDEYTFDVRDLPTWTPPPQPEALQPDDPPEARATKEAAWSAYHAREPEAIAQAVRDAIDQHLLSFSEDEMPPLAPTPETPETSPADPPPSLVVFIRGGLVQDVCTTTPLAGVRVLVADFDIGPSDTGTPISWPDGSTEQAAIAEFSPSPHVDALTIATAYSPETPGGSPPRRAHPPGGHPASQRHAPARRTLLVRSGRFPGPA